MQTFKFNRGKCATTVHVPDGADAANHLERLESCIARMSSGEILSHRSADTPRVDKIRDRLRGPSRLERMKTKLAQSSGISQRLEQLKIDRSCYE